MDCYLIFDLLSFSLILKNDFLELSKYRLICKDTNNNIKNNDLYKRKKSARLLKKTLMQLFLNIDLFSEIIKEKKDYKSALYSIYNVGVENDDSFHCFQKNVVDYNKDKFNPFKHLRLFKYLEFNKKIQNGSLNLKMALDHAEKTFSVLRIITINDYY